ncbi:MAG: tat pathway signal sequence [Mycobacterium sp.]
MKRLLLVMLVGVLCAVAPPPVAQADFSARVAQAEEYLATRPGIVGYVLRDRTTGLAHRNQAAGALIWTASTIKLAMVVDLLTRATAGQINLTPADRQLMVDMMRSSDNDAADQLWERFGGPDHMAFNRNFPSYGMTGVRPQPGFGDVYPYWGFQKATADDLDRLMNYTLGRLPAAQAAAIVAEMQGVDANQQWGVWGAGPQMAPGNKNGWSPEQGGWVVNSVGFAGPGQRYTLAIMNSLEGEGGFEDGLETTTRLAKILLGPG